MRIITQDMVDEAIAELAHKSEPDIELETAAKWGSRAVAAWQYYCQTNDVRWRDIATVFRHEAIEHGATAGPRIADQLTWELDKAFSE